VSQYFLIHPRDPQPRLIRRACEIVRAGGVIVYPTDSCYALGCPIGDKAAMERIRALRGHTDRHHLTLSCRNLAEVGQYARIDDWQFRIMKSATPGSYVFILPATREVPRRLLHARRKTIGVRIADHRVAGALLAELGEPLLSSTLILAGDEHPLDDPAEMRVRLERSVDLVMDAGPCGIEPSTVVDLTGTSAVITRMGKGSTADLGVLDGL